MAQQFRTVPTYIQGIAEGVRNNTYWYRYFQAADTGQPPASETAVTLTGSPLSFVAPRAGFVIITGGTVTSVMYSRTPGTFYLTGHIAGQFQLSQNDVLKITYTGTPTITFAPT